MPKYKITYKRDETGWWLAHAKAFPGCHTQGRTIEEAKRRIREALDLYVPDSNLELDEEIRIPTASKKHIENYVSTRAKLTVAKDKYTQARNEVIKLLTKDMGLSVRDIGKILRLSYQRVHQVRKMIKPETKH